MLLNFDLLDPVRNDILNTKSNAAKKTWKDGDLVSTHRYIRAINSSDLNPAARRCGIAMAGAFGLKRPGVVVASTRFLAIVCNGGRSTAQDAVKELVAEGWVRPAGQFRGTNAFQLVFAKAEEALEGLVTRLREAFGGEDDEMDLMEGFGDGKDDSEKDRAAVQDEHESGPSRPGERSAEARSAALCEARDGATKGSKTKERSPVHDPDDWPVDWRDQFWNIYPVRKNVRKAEEELTLIGKTGVKLESILIAARRYARQLKDVAFCKNPVFWLEDEPWKDNMKQSRRPSQSNAAI
jgi:hypothetical protein